MSFDPLGPLHAEPRLVTFMTDFGLRDPSAGVLSGVVLGIAPAARTLDLTHAIPPYDVEAGAEALVESLVHLPVGAHVAVVDPGVGTRRRPIAIRCRRGDVLIGPGELRTVVRIIDGFGTLVFAGGRDDIGEALGTLVAGEALVVTIGKTRVDTVWAHRFGDVAEGEPLCYLDSAGRLALAVNRGSAAERYGAARRSPISIKRA